MSALAADINAALENPLVEMRHVAIRPGALHEVVDALHGARRVAYLTDANMFTTATDENVKQTIQALLEDAAHVTKVVIEGEVHADENTVARAVDGCVGVEVIVTFGSGTLCDIGKVAAAKNGARHVVLQSASSVNGFADDQSVLLVNGVKRTTHSGWPDVLLIDVDVVSHAPVELNASGLGDMISMFSAPADWYLSSLFNLDRGWNPDAAMLTRRHGEQLLSIAPGLARGDADAAKTLSEFVTLSGFSMGVAGQTSPSSGMEHTVSHMLDMAKGARGESTAHHGAQVGVATIVATRVWERMSAKLAAGELSEFTILSDEDARARINEAFGWMDESGSTANECWNDYKKKIDHLREIRADTVLAHVQDGWPEHAAALESMLAAPARVANALKAAGAPVTFATLNEPASDSDVVWALTNCHLMRSRFTIADLAFATGNWTVEDIAEVQREVADIA